MVRWGVLAAGATVVVGAAFVTGASVPPKPPAVAKGDPIRAVVGQKIGFFNIARAMRENKRAVIHLAAITDRQKRAVAQVKGMRDMYLELQKRAEQTLDAEQKYRLVSEMRVLARMIEDFDREHNKGMHDRANSIISEIYDDMRAATAEMARENGLVAVLAYPDAVTPEEMNNPMIKEMKLKPPAAQPFYLDPGVDYTDDLLQRLNARFAAENGGN